MALQDLIRHATRVIRRTAPLGTHHDSSSSDTSTARTPDELRERVARLGTWMYRFDLGGGVYTTLHDEYLEDIHRTRAAMIFPEIDRTFEGRWAETTCLDGGCNEGYFAFEVAKRGAKAVVGFDAREINIEKAEFVRSVLGIRSVSFRVDDVLRVTPERYGSFDLTLCLGLLYHLEDPMGALRHLRAVTKELCVIDTEVVRPGAHATLDRGPKDGVVQTQDVIAVIAEPAWQWNPLLSVTGVSLVPSTSALLTLLKHAGFRDVTQVQPSDESNERYRNFDRAIFFARV